MDLLDFKHTVLLPSKILFGLLRDLWNISSRILVWYLSRFQNVAEVWILFFLALR